MNEKLEREILSELNMTKTDIEKHIKNGVYIYEMADYIKNFDEYTASLDDTDKISLKDFLKPENVGRHWNDCDLIEHDSVIYFIDYCL